MGNLLCLVQVDQSTVAIKETFGKFDDVLEPGCHCVPWIFGSRLAGHLTLRVQQLDVKCETKTKDNVFVNVVASIQYRALSDKASDAFYKLSNTRAQIQAYVFDVIRASVPKLNLDDAFEQKNDIAKAVEDELEKAMSAYGFEIVQTLIVDGSVDCRRMNIYRLLNRLKASVCRAKGYREMDNHIPKEEDNDINWDTEDELEIQNIVPSSYSTLVTRNSEAIISNEEASSSAGYSNSNLIQHFLGMGFPENLVLKAIKEDGDTESILETLLTLTALDNSPEEQSSCDLNSHQQQQCVNNDELSSDYDEGLFEDFSESDSWSDDEITENVDLSTIHDPTVLSLASMGYTVEEASAAMERCGPDASIDELTDIIYAAQMAKADSKFFEEEKPKNSCGLTWKQKRKMFKLEAHERKKQKGPLTEEDDIIRVPNPMIGYGVPSESSVITTRTLPEAAIGPPFFYYENVALAPKGVWQTISRFLYDIEPEFVDSKYFCAAARKRGYVHNLPINNRFPILPLPPRTIHDALPLTKKWWPEWDKRTKLNCLQTVYGSARMTNRVREALKDCADDPPLHVQKFVIEQCRKWNLVWVGKSKVAILEPDEVEMLLGFPKNHTRGGGISRTDRYKSLGNSFQVDTVAYHLSVLKDIFPNGINVLSLFSGIGGAEVALDRLRIPLKNVVSVEISEANRDIVRSWWEQTKQKGNLVHLSDIQQVNGDTLERYIESFGGFDLVVGGSPCNNLTGGNRVSRDGLEGEHSALFYDYFRILDLVKCIMSKQN